MPGQGRGRIRVEAHVESALLERPVIGQFAALCERRLADGEAPQPQLEGRVFPSSEGRFGPKRGFQPVRRRHHRGGRAAVVVPRRPHRGRARADGGAFAEPVHRVRWMSGGADIGRHRVAPEATLILEGARGEGTGDDGPVNARRCGSEEAFHGVGGISAWSVSIIAASSYAASISSQIEPAGTPTRSGSRWVTVQTWYTTGSKPSGQTCQGSRAGSSRPADSQIQSHSALPTAWNRSVTCADACRNVLSRILRRRRRPVS